MHPEAIVQLDGTDIAVGGLTQSRTFLAYCNRSDFVLAADPKAFRYLNHSVSPPVAPFPWTPG